MTNKQGYVFLDVDQLYLPGDIYRHDTEKSRWCCVDDYIHKVLLLKWPANLYQVEVLDFVSVDEPPKLIKNPGYSRALSFRIVEVLPSAKLFGDYGDKICSILEWVQTAGISDFEKVGNSITEDMPKIYSKAWDEWLKTIDPDSYHIGYSHNGVIAIPTERKNPDSPINKGFFLISELLDQRAKALVGDDMWITYVPDPDDNFEEDDDPRCLAPLWSKAKYALFYAAMGFGAKDFLTESESGVLFQPWNNR